MNSGQYRVRQSCCLAVQDLLKSSGNKSVHDAVNYMNELWTKLFRVMDDHHEDTRKVATNTARVLSKVCFSYLCWNLFSNDFYCSSAFSLVVKDKEKMGLKCWKQYYHPC